ncbi:phosphatase PAP2 family protein [bacterium]|nr:MAG: phosphatase PAP2 family protein [bacterium]
MSLNKEIFFFFNNLAGKNNILDGAWVFLAQYAIFIFGLVMVYLLRKDRKLFIKASLSALITVVIVALVKKICFFPRPFAQEEARLLISHIADSTFPSKHTAVAFSLAFGIFLEKKHLGIWLLALALLIGLSRIVTGVHYPADILAGILIGICVSLLTHKFSFQKHKNPL